MVHKALLLLTSVALFQSALGRGYNPDYLSMVASAIKAPSGHNTQPWKFRIRESAVEIHPNLSCSLPNVDGDNRELYISLGCALENLCLAASQQGYQPIPSVVDSAGGCYISVRLVRGGASGSSYLFGAIEKRQTNRSVYSGRVVAVDTLALLQGLPLERGIRCRIIGRDERSFLRLTDYVMRGNLVQMNDRGFKAELLSWIRFNKGEVRRCSDGLTYKVMGSPSTPRCLGKRIVGLFLKADAQNKADLAKIRSSSHLVLFTSSGNTAEDWILTGRSLERFLLSAAQLGISCAYVNQPCEVKALAGELQQELLSATERPMLLLRIGYAPPAPYSPRKAVEDVVVE
ncbi:Acg family FMN-binding oxidoreductase [uncultured Acetobacteroides sp.]|uniref:Acg family FMN-binding oxidoreductase n=1 Tax=uncultured Acetobacteroides sp. TaxID=1760811 RepID=UPI0029F57B1E|nr:nitroreductase [uncultured Acetobacteroides sp.]